MFSQKKYLLIFAIFFILNIFLTSFAQDRDSASSETLKLENNKQGTTSNSDLEKLTLKQALEIAMQNNHYIRSAIAKLPISEASLIIAKYRPNPFIVNQFEIVKNGSIHPADVQTDIELGRKRYWRIKVAKEQISKTELEIAKVLWEVHTQVHATYAALSVGLELFNLAKARADFYNSLVDVAEKRFEAGDISKLELDRTKMQLLSAENDFSELGGRLKRAKIDFNHILGRESGSELKLVNSEELRPKIKVQEYKPLKNILSQAISKRLEMAILEKDFGITRAQLKQYQWQRVPNLTILGGVAMPSYHDNIWGPDLGGQIEVPVFNRKQGEIKQARAQIEYLEKERERIEHDINIEVANAMQDLQVREEQVQRFQEKLLGGSENILEMIKTAYQKGKLSLTDVLNAEQQNRDLKEKYFGSLLNYQYALASLEYATGVPLYGLTEK